MTITDELIQRHESSLIDTLEKLLIGISQCRDIHSDANITKLMEANVSMIKHYTDDTRETFLALEKLHPSIIRQVSVNVVKRQRVEKAERAIAERREMKTELMRKLKALRRNVPEQLKQKLNTSLTYT
jgi:hypothetical protein